MPDFLISFLLAAALVFAVYFSMLVMLTGHRVLEWIDGHFLLGLSDSSWIQVRFVLLGTIALLLLWAIFAFARPRNDRYRVWPGALAATAGIVLMSTVFSALIGRSVRYSWVYGSLASLILLMFWLYLICQTIFVGAALNIALRNRKALKD